MQRALLYILISLLLLLLHTSLVKFLAIGGIIPDVLVIWIVYVAIREGQVSGMTAGFILGLIIDLLSGSDGMLGLSALTKATAGFLAGYFYNENKTFQTLSGYQFIVAVSLVSLVHNVIYFLIFLQGSGIGWWGAVLMYGMPTTAYTAAVSLLPMFIYARKYA